MLSVNISDENLFKETWKKQRSNYSNGNTLGGNMPRWKNYNIAKKKKCLPDDGFIITHYKAEHRRIDSFELWC